MFVSHDLEWLYPDDALLWSFLRRARASQRTPLILARKISPATFTVLKIVGARARQYFAMVLNPSAPDTIVGDAAEAGWLRTERADANLFSVIREQFLALVPTAPPVAADADKAIFAAEELKFMRETGPRRRIELWADAINVEMPVVWLNAIRRWPVYSRYKRRSAERPFQSAEEWSAVLSTLPPAESGAAEEFKEKPATPFGRTSERSRVPTVIR